ncbi:SGNH/GDSL hydrolase family protein [Bifidobacterium vespertilionis]|uniref:SGNH/GDSL hydrolase family protein n=1 Tax=Bifidobacterium vespertilionis TaxID=2562524 RepID=UPI001BDC3E32|nr:SGNH/GDSL hydrolase family protein [Bifidobacterium vespertilionis]MBT1178528.1 SGNH/GDSL hydrolase family protein [Bifidobacterium vespertilionis]
MGVSMTVSDSVRSDSADSAGLAITRIPSSRARIVCIGDSITHGDTGLGFNAPRPWPEQVGEMLGVEVFNCGHNGIEAARYRECPEWELAKSKLPGADLVTFMLGTNDIGHDFVTSPDDVPAHIARYVGLIEEAAALTPHAEVAVLSIIQFALGEPVMSRFGLEGMRRMNVLVDELNPAYRCMCREHGWHFVDFAVAINQHRDLYGNSIHPNQDGYDVMARVLAPRLSALLGA